MVHTKNISTHEISKETFADGLNPRHRFKDSILKDKNVTLEIESKNFKISSNDPANLEKYERRGELLRSYKEYLPVDDIKLYRKKELFKFLKEKVGLEVNYNFHQPELIIEKSSVSKFYGIAKDLDDVVQTLRDNPKQDIQPRLAEIKTKFDQQEQARQEKRAKEAELEAERKVAREQEISIAQANTFRTQIPNYSGAIDLSSIPKDGPNNLSVRFLDELKRDGVIAKRRDTSRIFDIEMHNPSDILAYERRIKILSNSQDYLAVPYPLTSKEQNAIGSFLKNKLGINVSKNDGTEIVIDQSSVGKFRNVRPELDNIVESLRANPDQKIEDLLKGLEEKIIQQQNEPIDRAQSAARFMQDMTNKFMQSMEKKDWVYDQKNLLVASPPMAKEAAEKLHEELKTTKNMISGYTQESSQGGVRLYFRVSEVENIKLIHQDSLQTNELKTEAVINNSSVPKVQKQEQQVSASNVQPAPKQPQSQSKGAYNSSKVAELLKQRPNKGTYQEQVAALSGMRNAQDSAVGMDEKIYLNDKEISLKGLNASDAGMVKDALMQFMREDKVAVLGYTGGNFNFAESLNPEQQARYSRIAEKLVESVPKAKEEKKNLWSELGRVAREENKTLKNKGLEVGQKETQTPQKPEVKQVLTSADRDAQWRSKPQNKSEQPTQSVSNNDAPAKEHLKKPKLVKRITNKVKQKVNAIIDRIKGKTTVKTSGTKTPPPSSKAQDKNKSRGGRGD
ncbi:MAG: hypothetical protein K0Q51_438 [Rickettsiaceae bacterium]|jgi:hypothetical protein|nr:hypothetical protein [Rickettsiaceae bacterium]